MSNNPTSRKTEADSFDMESAYYLADMAYDYMKNKNGSIESLVRAMADKTTEVPLTPKEKQRIKTFIRKLNEAL